jgi:hypothetical protein
MTWPKKEGSALFNKTFIAVIDDASTNIGKLVKDLRTFPSYSTISFKAESGAPLRGQDQALK